MFLNVWNGLTAIPGFKSFARYFLWRIFFTIWTFLWLEISSKVFCTTHTVTVSCVLWHLLHDRQESWCWGPGDIVTYFLWNWEMWISNVCLFSFTFKSSWWFLGDCSLAWAETQSSRLVWRGGVQVGSVQPKHLPLAGWWEGHPVTALCDRGLFLSPSLSLPFS